MNPLEANEVATWVRQESKLLFDEGRWAPMGSPLETRVLEAWKHHRPKMYQALRAKGAVESLAHVLTERAWRTELKNLRAGLPPTDAREQAEKDWLLLEPEDDEETSILPTLKA